MLRRTLPSRIVAATIAAIMAVWSTAVCMATASTPHASHACCVKTAEARTGLAAPRTCCVETSANYFAAAFAPFSPSTLPVATGWQLVAALEAAASSGRHSLNDVPVRPPGRPTYLAVSSLRL